MAIDTSIYGQLRPIEMPDVIGSATKALTLSQLARQNMAADQSFQDREAMRKAVAANSGPEGINHAGVLSMLAQSSPSAMMQYQEHQNKAAKDAAEAKIKGNEAYGGSQAILGNYYNIVKNAAPEHQGALYSSLRADAIQKGIASAKDLPEKFDPSWFGQQTYLAQNTKGYLDNQHTAAQTRKINAETVKLIGQKDLTPGQKQADETAGKELAEYSYLGGKSNVEKNIGLLQDAIQSLKKDPELTAGWTTKLPLLNSDTAQDTINPKLAQVRDQIRGAIQSGLKQVLGGQYTEREGEAMFSRAFNPRLSAEENVRRATAELESLKRMAAAKDESMQRFAATGTLKGMKPGETDLNTREVVAANSKMPGKTQSGLIQTAYADENKSQKKAPGIGVGAIVMIKGKHYRVGSDGDTLTPVKGSN